jgi:hypothetical protein
MQSTLMGRATPHRPLQRALSFSLLFGASGGVARTDLLPVPSADSNRPVARVPRRLGPNDECSRSRLGGESRLVIDVGAARATSADGKG